MLPELNVFQKSNRCLTNFAWHKVTVLLLCTLMQIGILSDTHSYMDDRILHHLKGCDEIWHAGDFGDYHVIEKIKSLGKTVRGVYGNIDGKEIRNEFPESLAFSCGGLQVWMIHIAGYPGRYQPYVKDYLKQNKTDILICGHSHILKVMRDPVSGVLNINPGAAGQQGWQKVRTLILMEVKKGKQNSESKEENGFWDKKLIKIIDNI